MRRNLLVSFHSQPAQTLIVLHWPQWHSDDMELNPYAKFLDGRDPVEVLTATSARLKDLAARVPQEQLTMRAPQGKWNAREIVAHLADCELVFGFRLR